ncbi:MAG: agmatine deiminase family protein [Legionella sp.]
MNPIELGFKMPAEWHPHTRCWMAWPSHQQTWQKIGLKRATMAFAQVANAIAQYEQVTMLVNPAAINEASLLCSDVIELVPLAMNDSWTRDTGPTFLLDQQGKLAGIDWIHNAWGGNYDDYSLDNLIASKIIERCNAHYFHAPLVMEGGSFHVDGEGTILTTKECLLNKNRNPSLSQNDIEEYLKNYLGGEKVIWLNNGLVGDETNGHIDEIACFIAPGKVLALVTNDKNDVNYEILQNNIKQLQSTTDALGRPLQVYTIEQPPATYLDGERLTLSYVNFYLANKGIVMPAFGYAKYDESAYQLFKNLYPDHQITQLAAIDIFAGGGGIHCITQQQPLAK